MRPGWITLLLATACTGRGESPVPGPEPAAPPAAMPGGSSVPDPPSAGLEQLAARIRGEPDAAVRGRLLVRYLAEGLREGARLDAMDAAVLERAFTEVAAEDPAWGVEPRVLGWALPHVEGIEPFLEQVVATNPVADVRGATLLGMARVARQEGRPADVRALASRAGEVAPTSKFTAELAQLDPEGPIVVGKPVPEFQLDDGTVTAATLRGKTTLVAFWATWCGACEAELDALRPLHEKYADRGFRVVTVAIDEERAALDRFRAERGPVPWVETWHPPRVTAGLRAQFEVVAIPAMVLLGPDGTVLADGAEARPAVLAEALPQLLP